MSFTAIFEPIANEMRWSYTQISIAASLRGMEASLAAPIVGRLVDRWGPRRLIFSGSIIVVTGLVFLSNVTSIAMFYGAFFIIAIGTSCFATTVLTTAIANWFKTKIGIASGIVASGFACGGLLIPVIVRLIDIYDWRLTMTILAMGGLAILLPLSLLFRHKPEQYGYFPDGQIEDQVKPDTSLGLARTDQVDVNTKQALKTNNFWHIAMALALQLLVVNAISTHVMPFLSSVDMTRPRASLVATGLPLISILGRLGLGWIGDRRDTRCVIAVGFAIMGLGLLCFGYVSSANSWLLIPFLILYGTGYGGTMVLRISLVRQYFGRTNFGSIFGMIIGITMFGGIIGPSLAGWVYDSWGSYHTIWLIFVALIIMSLILVLTITQAKQTAQL